MNTIAILFPPPDGAADNLLTFDPLDATVFFDLVADDPFFVPPPVPPVLAQGANVVPPNPTVPLVQQHPPPPVPLNPPVPLVQQHPPPTVPLPPQFPPPANEAAEDNGAFDDDYTADNAHEAQYEADDEGAYGDAANTNELGATIDAELGAAADTVQPDRYNLRTRTTRQDNFNVAMDEPYNGQSYFPPTHLVQAQEDIARRAVAYVMTQMTAKAGIKKFGEAAVIAMVQEFGQFEDLKVYEPIDV
jgi:hypothetical protein